MLKNLAIGAAVFVVLLLLALTYLTARYVDQKEIHRAEMEMEHMRGTRDSTLAFVAAKDSVQSILTAQVRTLLTDAEGLRRQVADLERERQQQQLSVRRLQKKEDLQAKLRQTYPEMAQSDWGVTEVFSEKGNLQVEYLLIPLWFSETFIIEHQNAENYRKQRDKLQHVDSLQQSVAVLKDSVLALEQEKSRAYKNGYDDAYAKYETLNEKYIELLKKPPSVEVGLPAWWTVLGSAAVGVAVGSQLK